MSRGPALRQVRLRDVRRLAVRAQRLDRTRPASCHAILDLVEHLGCVQIDPISVVAPTQHLVLWSRLGAFDVADLDALRGTTGRSSTTGRTPPRSSPPPTTRSTTR